MNIGRAASLSRAYLWGNIVGTANNVAEHLAWVIEDGQPKISGLEWCVWVLVGQQEVLWFEIPEFARQCLPTCS